MFCLEIFDVLHCLSSISVPVPNNSSVSGSLIVAESTLYARASGIELGAIGTPSYSSVFRFIYLPEP